jgi:hypothetical protein
MLLAETVRLPCCPAPRIIYRQKISERPGTFALEIV